jgi:UDP-GlcNAc:undecaprenyl-phosphate GlcNAc-1-phosphate transferase
VYSILILAFSSFVLCLVFTPLVTTWSRRQGILDLPGAARRAHRNPTPRTGGIAIALAYVLPVSALLLSPLNAADSVNLPAIMRLLPPALLVFSIGLVDDLVGMKPWEKLLGQAVAAWLAYQGGVQFTGVGGYHLPAMLSMPLTVAWLIACANAFNLIDGIDGLASGVGAFAAATMLVGALVADNASLALATAPLVGALLAFLRYNFNPASIFLGDCGSLTIGFVLGCFGAIWSQKSVTMLGMTAPIMALALPLVDTSISVVRRFLRRQPIFTADGNHIHHRLLARGLNHRQVALILYGACGVGAVFSLLVTVPGSRLGGLVLLAFCGVVWGGIRLLGYAELDTAQRLMVAGVFRHVLGARLYTKSVEDRCARALTIDQFWNVACDVGREFRCVHVRMSLAGTVYEKHEPGNKGGTCCTIRIPLSAGDYLNLSYPVSQSMRNAVALAAVVEILQGAVALNHPEHRHEPRADAAEAPATAARTPEVQSAIGETVVVSGFSRTNLGHS